MCEGALSCLKKKIKTKSKYIYEDINFDSSWELIFWLYNKEVLNNNITRSLEPLIIRWSLN